MINSVADYLSLLRKELAGCDPATIQEALSDSEEYLRMALGSAIEADPSLSEAEALASIIEKFGAPGEVSTAYRESEKEERGSQGRGWKWAFFSFRGRLERKRYIIGSLLLFVVIAALWIGWFVWMGDEEDLTSLVVIVLLFLFTTAIAWPDAALATKRLRDMDREPLLVLLYVMLPSIPILGAIAKLSIWGWLLSEEGTAGPNKYGPDPLAEITDKAAFPDVVWAMNPTSYSANAEANLAEFRKRAIMTTTPDLEQIDKKTRASYYEDGLSDIGMGILLLGWGLLLLHPYSMIFFPLFLLSIMVPPIGRRLVTYPRSGMIDLGFRFSGKRRQMEMVILIFCCVIAFLMISVPGHRSISPSVEGFLVGLGFLLLLGSVAHFSGQRSLYAYGLIMGISMVLAKTMDNPAGDILMWAPGVLIVLIGLAMTARFLRKYPKARGVAGTEAAKDSSWKISDPPAHEQSRLVILSHLYVVKKASFLFLLRETGLSFGNLSSYISELEATGYVMTNKRSAGLKLQTTLCITDSGRHAVREYQQRMKQI